MSQQLIEKVFEEEMNVKVDRYRHQTHFLFPLWTHVLFLFINAFMKEKMDYDDGGNLHNEKSDFCSTRMLFSLH